MLKVLLTVTVTLLVGIALLPQQATAEIRGKLAEAKGGSTDLSSQQRLTTPKTTKKATVKKKIMLKKINPKASRPSVKLNPQPEPPSAPAGSR